jgi:hypothetical protein
MGTMKYQDVNINTHWTISVRLGQNGVSYAQGRGIINAENNEVTTNSINGIAKPNSSGGGSSSRGVSMFRTSSHNGGKLSQLNDLVAVYELEQDNDGNYTSKMWEWK